MSILFEGKLFRSLLKHWIYTCACLSLVVAALQIPAAAASQSILLIDAIESLRASGYKILYSSDLVNVDSRVTLNNVSLQSVRKELPKQGLALKRMGALWIITRDNANGQFVSGYLVSSEGAPIVNGRVTTSESQRASVSRSDGYFEIKGVSLNDKLEVSAEGFQSRVIHRDTLQENPILLLEEQWMESVIVTGSRYRLPGEDNLLSSLYLSGDEIALVPSLGGDSLRVVTRLPGVSSVGVTAKPRIRGGLQDEILILLDGVELLEPFHLADFHSVFSTIDGRTVDSIDFYTGGFPVRYGNRMSGVMDISTAMPVSDSYTELGVSLFSSSFNTRGYSDKNLPLDWLISARRSNLGDISSMTASDLGTPRYSDAFARMGMSLSDRVDLYLGLFAVEDDVTLIDDEERATSGIDTYHLWSRLDTIHSEQLFSSLVFSYLFSERKQAQSVVEEDSNEPGQEASEPGFLDYRQIIERYSVRNDYVAQLGDHILEFGIEAQYGRSDYDYASFIERGVISELFGNSAELQENTKLDPQGWSGGGYATLQFKLSPKLTLQPGLRWDVQDYYSGGSSEQLSPRLGMLYEISRNLTMRGSVGRFYQPEGLYELQLVDGVTQFFSPQQSDQAIIGLKWQYQGLSLKSEAYYKRYRDQKARFENLFNTFVLQPHMEPDRVKISPEKALVRGFEVEAGYDFSSRLSGRFRYSYLDAEDRINGSWVPRRWSQEHTVNAGLIWQKGGFSLSGNLTWHTGWWASSLPPAVKVGTVLPLESVLNNTRLSDYVSLDISASKSWQIGGTRVTVNGDITNVLGRNNLSGFEYDVDQSGDEIFLDRHNKKLLPLAPSIGITVSF